MSDIELFDAIRTARSLRRLKPDPVPEALITQVLDAAVKGRRVFLESGR
jgi:nitroreductase